MVFKCGKGMFQLQRNFRDAFNMDKFIEKYIEECFDKYLYIVGDISSSILRLKGFNTDVKSENYFGFIDSYLDTSCAIGCPYFVLKRLKPEEYNKLAAKPKEVDTTGSLVVKELVKENYDKESLTLNSNPKVEPNIVVDAQKFNAIPKGNLPADIVEFISNESNNNNNNASKAEPVVVETQTYVSASPDFDPSKKESFKKNNNNNNQNKNSNFNKNKRNRNKK